VLAFPGEYGTLSEMAFALKAGKPLVSVNGWDLGGDVIRIAEPVEAAARALELAIEHANRQRDR
jgi:hypothetical protein